MLTCHATNITNNSIRYKCLWKRGFHIHGSNGDLSNRIEYRQHHCLHFEGPVCIVIDEDTLRVKPKQRRKKPKTK